MMMFSDFTVTVFALLWDCSVVLCDVANVI